MSENVGNESLVLSCLGVKKLAHGHMSRAVRTRHTGRGTRRRRWGGGGRTLGGGAGAGGRHWGLPHVYVYLQASSSDADVTAGPDDITVLGVGQIGGGGGRTGAGTAWDRCGGGGRTRRAADTAMTHTL